MSDNVTPKEENMNNINYVEGIIRHMITQENPTHARDIAQELADAGLIAPDTPEPGKDFITGNPVWEGDDTLGVIVYPDGEISMMIGVDSETDYTPSTAREQALALLAAANHAEGETNA